MNVVKFFRKAAVERIRLYVSYDCFLAETESLHGINVLVSPQTPESPLVVDHAFPDLAKRRLIMYVSGGKPNTSYILQFLAETSERQVKRDDVGMRVVP